uniref:putative F-box protein At4g05475 n=1 Tax=Erigeron canadensis TaxID=72917 RepID=UPI001CB98D72|nr:putative F-box protein At4g05475 [Erigeron canadensis]
MMSSKPNRRQKGKQKSDFVQKPPNQLNFNKDDEDEEVRETVKVRKLNGVDFNTQGQVDDLRNMISAEQVTKPSTSNSSRRKGKNSNYVPKPKQVEQPTVNWLDLPSDVTANILSRIGVFDIIENAQKVCTTWYQICKEPAMWRAVSMDQSPLWTVCQKICKHVVNRSQGQMVDISIKDFCDRDLLQYITYRSTQLRRLEVIHFFGRSGKVWGGSLKKFSLLEDLSLENTIISDKDIEVAGHHCPLLKKLKINQKAYLLYGDYDESMTYRNALAVAIGKDLPELRHLELIGNTMTNIGLKAILDGCHHLESLDLRRCLYIDLKGDLGKRCSEQIKHLKLPHDSLEGYQHLELPDDVPEPDYFNDYCYGGLTCSSSDDSDVEMDYNTFLSML